VKSRGSGSSRQVGQTLLSVRYDTATAHPDRQECLSYQNPATCKLIRHPVNLKR